MTEQRLQEGLEAPEDDAAHRCSVDFDVADARRPPDLLGWGVPTKLTSTRWIGSSLVMGHNLRDHAERGNP